jgi:ATP-dependent Lhr-like helicase
MVIFHALYGRRINDALSRIFAIMVADKYDVDVAVNISDNGFVLVTGADFELRRGDIERLMADLSNTDVEDLLKRNIKRTEMMKRRFRYCAARSFMILRNYKGYKISVRKQQVSAQILLKAVEDMDPDFPILKETYREILEDVMDLPRARRVIADLMEGTLKYRIIDSNVPSPFSHIMITFGESDVIMMADRRKHLRELHRQVLRKIKEMNK